VNEQELRRRYVTDSIQTASPAARLGMLYDRLQLDLERADSAFAAGNTKGVSDNLIHAQEILLALHNTLRLDQWDAAKGLAALYMFLHGELVASNMSKDRSKAAIAAGMISKLAEAWRGAAENAARDQAMQGASTGGLA